MPVARRSGGPLGCGGTRRGPANQGIGMMRYLGLFAALMLAGCIEAADLAQERITAPDYCPTQNGIAICEDAEG